jgi:type VI secretion system protein ImpE
LREAIDAQERLVDGRPDNLDDRLFLCELLLFDGNLEAARSHLDFVPDNSSSMLDYLDANRRLLDAEAKRRRMFANVGPIFLIDPPAHAHKRVEALLHLREQRFADAMEALDDADAMCPWISGHVDGRNFNGVRDGDDLFGSLLEVLLDDCYVWFPFEQIDRLRLGPPESLRDYLFRPAHLRAVTGEEWSVHLPALYPDSHRHADADIKLGRSTDWIAEKDGPTMGQGLRTLTFGQEELTLLDFTQWEK